MTNEELVSMLNEDLRNERMHMMFYLQSGVMITGLEREEIGEFLIKEAQSEFKHVEEFSRMIVRLGGVPTLNFSTLPCDLRDPREILEFAAKMEEEVAGNYFRRLKLTDEFTSPEVAAIHLFYEDQLTDSWATAKEIRLLLS